MAKFRVHYDARKPGDNGGMTAYIDVEADFDYVAMKLAEAQFFARNRLAKDYIFVAKRIEKRG